MIYPLRDKKRIAQRNKVAQTIAWFAIFLLIALTGILAWTGRLFMLIGHPVWKTQQALTTVVENNGYLLRTKASVFAENERLAKENIDLKNSMLDYTVLKKENDTLKELVGRLPSNHTFILGTIESKPNRSPYDTIIIDTGSDTGVTEGMRVFANAITPIGKVSKVYSHESVVMLYSNPGQITEAMIEGSNASVELVGRGGGNFEMTIPLDLGSEKGTLIVLPNTQSEVVATIEEVISAPSDPLKKVILRTPINIQNLKWVQVEKN
jgi:cell shape-determining protein MreC